MSGFTVTHEELEAKSDAVGEVAASIKECSAAADEMGVGGLVYGVFFDPTMLPLLSSAKDILKLLIGSLGDAGTSIADGLKHNANTYRSVEEFIVTHLEQALKGIG